MFPVIQIGPAALPAGPLALVLGVWLGAWLAEREAARLGLDGDKIATLILFAVAAGLLGARLGYVARHLGAYAGDPLGIFSPNPAALDAPIGLLAAASGGLAYGRRHGLPLWRALDALAPGAAALLLALGVAHLASGDAFGAPAELPWSVVLWEQARHPSQVYEILAALAVLGLWRLARDRRPFDGLGFLLVAALSAAARVFLEAFRGDSASILGGLRAAQVGGLLVLALCLWMLGRLAGRIAR